MHLILHFLHYPPLSPLSPCNKSLPRPNSGCGRVVSLSSIGSYEENEDSLTPLSPLLVAAPLPFTIFPYESTLWGMIKAKCLPCPPELHSGKSALESSNIRGYEENEGPFTPLPVSANTSKPVLQITSRYDCPIDALNSALLDLSQYKSLPLPPSPPKNAKTFGHSRGRDQKRMNSI
jgi:hypothetical protein